MDRITHQSPRQQGYGSTSSLRNDSLKHTRKHERKEGGIEPRNKAARLWRTVRPGGTDCPHRPRGLSGLLPRTVRTRTADRLALSRGLSEKANRTSSSDPNNRPSAGSTRTVRQAPADCPPGTRGPSETSPNQNSKTQWIENEGEKEHEEHSTNTARADRLPPPRGLSALHEQTKKQPDLEGQLPQLITRSPKR
jgi:hypothetical protein